MYGIYTYIWLIFMVNVAKYTIHGWYGLVMRLFFTCTIVADERAPPSRTPQKSKGLMGARFEGQSVTAVAISEWSAVCAFTPIAIHTVAYRVC